VVGCLLIDGGLDYQSAIDRIAKLRAATRKAADVCPESPAQHQVLRERAALTPSNPRRHQFTQPRPVTPGRPPSASDGEVAR
jgi:hypothetical protein